jgi:septal ring factor EnvC (AmiA/AmiB activator)
MKFKFLTLTLLVLALNCQAAEQEISVFDERLIANSEFVKLNDDIQRLKHDISIYESSLKNVKHSRIFCGDREISMHPRIAELEIQLAAIRKQLDKKREERKKIVKSIIRSTKK